MEKTKEMSIEEFCKEFDQVDDDAYIGYFINNDNFEFSFVRQKKDIEFWVSASNVICFSEEHSDISAYNIQKCVMEKYEENIEYNFYDKNEKVLFIVSVLKE